MPFWPAHVSTLVPLSYLLNWYRHREQLHRLNVSLAGLGGVKPVVRKTLRLPNSHVPNSHVWRALGYGWH